MLSMRSLAGTARLLTRSFSETALLSNQKLLKKIADKLAAIPPSNFKRELLLESPQGPHTTVESKPMLNFCANNYLGLSSHPKVIEGAKSALESYGFGLSSVRFICGTQVLHRQLERKLALFHGTEDSILFVSAFDANGGLFEALLDEKDAVVSDALNHASIIDGIRLCKARRYRYKHLDTEDLEAKVQQARAEGAETVMIATDGVFSMDGDIAPLGAICDVADRHSALVMVDDAHGTGVLGSGARGTPEYCGVMKRVPVLVSTLGKALGGGNGGYVTGPQPVIDLLRQKARPYLFSNAVAPCIVGASLAALDLLGHELCGPQHGLLARLRWSTEAFRKGIAAAGFQVKPGHHPIVPVMLGEERVAFEMARRLQEEEGIFVVAFSYPVVPRGEARIRVQLSAAHTVEDVERCLAAFQRVGKKMGLI